MKLPKHKMAKMVNKTARTAKHKDSAKHKAKLEQKSTKSNQMDMDETQGNETEITLTVEQKAAAKIERKKLNAHKILYKKNNYNCTAKNGPRSINGSGSNLS
mmetsp:Transcript_16018/g.27023  ORF Transcript_16018/g.27023 Transcript_16018/m.27023 type:complete len:102 (-) Transcript_16018:5703-6008(-)